jgi:hypothetical protein
MSLENNIKILERNSSDNQYLHKDFHGALCYAVKYLDDTFGMDATAQYLAQVGTAVYKPLIEAVKKEGLIALERHFKHIFELEGGQAQFELKGDSLIIRVSKCSAITHLRSIGGLFSDRYCETTVKVNSAICEASGYQCSCDYQPGAGCCEQHFWKKGTSR